jgi:hypothetical protein
MGAVFFMMLMAILFFVAILFIIVSVIFIIVWKTRKRRGKTSKKRWLVIPVVLLVISVFVVLIPVSYIVFLRYANNANKPNIVYAESGKVVYWPSNGNGDYSNWFEMDGKKYVQFREGFSDDPFYLDCGRDKLGDPIANLKIRTSDGDAFNDFMSRLLSGSTYAEQNVSTLYPIKNDNNFKLIYAENSPGSATIAGGAFCEEESLKSAKAYYGNLKNYDTENLKFEYTIYIDPAGWKDENSSPHAETKGDVKVKLDVFETLHNMQDSMQGYKSFEIPQKYTDIAKAKVPGTPFWGYKDRKLTAYSKDGIVRMEVSLFLMDGQVYVGWGLGGNKVGGRPLPKELNEYVLSTIFYK